MDSAGTSQKWRTKKDGHSGNVGQTDSKHFQAWPPESIGLGISTLETLKINSCLCHPLFCPSSHHPRWAEPKSAIIASRGTQPGYVENKYLRVCTTCKHGCESDTVNQYLIHLIIRTRWWHNGLRLQRPVTGHVRCKQLLYIWVTAAKCITVHHKLSYVTHQVNRILWALTSSMKIDS